eukprot:365033-Chlamydomonas_euryale.AAC.1
MRSSSRSCWRQLAPAMASSARCRQETRRGEGASAKKEEEGGAASVRERREGREGWAVEPAEKEGRAGGADWRWVKGSAKQERRYQESMLAQDCTH